MQYKLTLPTDFFADRLSTKLLQGIVRDLRPMGIALQFDISGLELYITKENDDFRKGEFEDIVKQLKSLFKRHYERSAD